VLVYGRYYLRRRVLAFRNDYCLACRTPRIAYLHRTVDVAHVFWLPVLPLGARERWLCSACGLSPHRRVETSRGLKWIGATLLALASIGSWATAPTGSGLRAAVHWALRLALPVATVLAARDTRQARPPEQLNDRLRHITPNRDAVCPMCRGALVAATPRWRCSRCGIERRSLPAA
jgi:hypothetical protein